MNSSVANAFFIFGVLIMTAYVLMVGEAILLPFIIAVFFWYLIRAVAHRIEKTIRLPYRFSLWVSIFIMIGLTVGFIEISKGNIQGFINQAPLYQDNIMKFVGLYAEKYGAVNKETIQEFVGKINFGAIASGIVNALGNVTTMTVTILLYLVFLFLEEKTFAWKLKALIKDKKKHAETDRMIAEIGRSFERYIGLKTAASVGMGLAGYAVLIYFGVDNALFWALIFGILNFIPYLGPVIGVALPFLAAVVQFGDLNDPAIVAVLLTVIAFVVGNIIEPKIFGNSLNLSPIVLMIALSFWGAIWGIIGMIICIPLMVGIMIALSKFDKTRPYALLMAEREPRSK